MGSTVISVLRKKAKTQLAILVGPLLKVLFSVLFSEAPRCHIGFLFEGGIKRRDRVKPAVIGNVCDIHVRLVCEQLFRFFYAKVVDIAVEIGAEMAVDEL